ncbi:MAG: DUF5666 domain-containing protein [Acidobacteriaceae bacterium]
MSIRLTGRKHAFLAIGLAALWVVAAAAQAQQAPAANRILGTVTAVNGNAVTVKTDTDGTVNVTVPDTAKILKTAPGQKTLTGATPLTVSEIEPGDRVLMLAPGDPPAAAVVIVNKKADLEALQQQQQLDWQRRGVGGLVKDVDPASGTVTIMSGSRMVTIHTTPTTDIRRYAPDSVKFSDAQPSTFAAIHPGDQVTARGDRNADGTEVTAQEIVSGSFRNIAGLITSVDAAAGTFTVRDWITKKAVTIHTTSDSDMRQLDPQIAQMIAGRLKAANGGGANGGHGGMQSASAGGGQNWRQNGGSGAAAAGGGSNAGGLARVLERSPQIHVADLHKGDAVMIVATSGSPDSATAIRVVAGVEPMLEASAKGSQNMFSSAWNLGGGSSGDSGDAGGGEGPNK